MTQVNPSALAYLKDLKNNNTRVWFNETKPRFLVEQAKIKDFHNAMQDNLKQHDKIDRYKLYRIYRDVRFSKDKTPYQPHFAAHFSRLGAELRGGYYLRIRPGESFIAGGFWNPNKEDLHRIRKEFEYDAGEFRAILNDENFKKAFPDFKGESLKTAPRGFDKNHPDIDLIRKKGFVAVRELSDQEVLDKDFLKHIDSYFKALRPFFDYMSSVLTTDLNGESLL